MSGRADVTPARFPEKLGILHVQNSNPPRSRIDLKETER